MVEKRKIEFFLLRYVPDAVKGEFVNIGLVAIGDGVLADIRFSKDRSRLLCLDPQADVEALAALERELRQEVGQKRDQTALLKKMEDSFSGVVEMSAVMPALTEKLASEEIEEVARLFLETAKVKRTREPAGRQKILMTMQGAWERAGVAGLMKPFPVAPFTKAGDPFRFDFGYRVGGEIKLFHAVSMRASVDAAVMLAARYPKIKERMLQAPNPVAPKLTAVVDDGLDRSVSEIGFALGMMEESRIRVAVGAEMPGIAEAVRMELGA
jgi:hypothetical protein